MVIEQNCHAICESREAIRLRAGCKINLYLRIVGIRQEAPHAGWHELDTVFAPLPEPFDTLILRRGQGQGQGQGQGVTVRCATPGIDLSDNTLTRAAHLFAAATGFAPDLEVELLKGIPHGAGLGGGSADAAALLLWLNSVAPTPLGDAELLALALKVGADVPFFVRGVPCRATGLGEVLEPCGLEPFAGLHLVLACPAVHVATPWAYRAYDEDVANGPKKNPENAARGLTGGGQSAISSFARLWRQPIRLVNDFEKVVFSAFPVLAKHKAFLLEAGAQAAVMSGSGASIFGLFREAKQAEDAASLLRKRGVVTYSHSFTSAR